MGGYLFLQQFTCEGQEQLTSFVSICYEVIGIAQSALQTLYNRQTLLKVSEILHDSMHVLPGKMFLPPIGPPVLWTCMHACIPVYLYSVYLHA